MNIKQDIEDIINECDPDGTIPDKKVSMLVDKLGAYMLKAYEEAPVEMMQKMNKELRKTNKNLDAIVQCLYSIGQNIISLEG